MYKMRIVAAVLTLTLVSLACQGFSGGGDNGPSAPAANPESSQSNDGTNVNSMFPLTGDAYKITELGEESLFYYSKMSQADIMKFYRDEYASKGYKEREILTNVTDATFNLVFDGDPSGKAVVIQSVDLGDGSRTITIRLEDVN